jgi:Zn-dependent protease
VRFDPELILALPVLALSVVVHECAHGLAAGWNGDPTARERGRITLNPLPHVDPVGTLVVPGLLALLHAPVVIGWARPVPVDRGRLRDPRNGPVWVALAGPAANLALALAFAALARVAPADGFFAPLGLMALAGVVVNCALGLFNLIPIPPLDGSWALMRLLPLRHIVALHHFRFAGLVLVALLLAIPAVSRVAFETPVMTAAGLCLALFGAPGAGIAR